MTGRRDSIRRQRAPSSSSSPLVSTAFFVPAPLVLEAVREKDAAGMRFSLFCAQRASGAISQLYVVCLGREAGGPWSWERRRLLQTLQIRSRWFEQRHDEEPFECVNAKR